MSGPKSYADDIALGGDRLLAPCFWHAGAKVAWFDIAQALSIEQQSWQLLILYINMVWFSSLRQPPCILA